MNYKGILCLGCTLLLVSCLFDPGSFFGAGDPDSRFEKSEALTVPTAPVVNDTDDFTFLVLADPHYGRYDSTMLKAERLRQTTPFEFLIVNGDITQRGLEEEWKTFEAEASKLGVPYYLTIGNHDLYNDGHEHFYNYFGPTHYTLSIGKLLLVFFDTANGVTSQKTKKWYEGILSAHRDKEIIGVTHYSYITENVQKMVTLPNPEEFYWMVDINAAYGVSAMLSGHYHTNMEQVFRGTYYRSIIESSASDGDQGVLVTFRQGKVSYKALSLD